MRKLLAIFILVGTIFVYPLSTLAEYNSATAQDYLLAHAENPWSTMALTLLGTDNPPADYLKSLEATSAIQFAAPILAITSLRQDPRTFGNKDYIAELKKYHINSQIGDPSTLNDDIFGLLALLSAGESVTDPVLEDAKNFLISHQQANGGWGFATSGGTDSNMTATAIVALIASGILPSDSKIQNAFVYLKTTQNADGGFTYDPQSPYGTLSDTSSTAWVIWALIAAGINPYEFSKSGNTPISYLESNQASQGYFKYQSGSGSEDAFSPITTAYAVIALAGKTLPLHIFTGSAKFEFRIEGKSNTVCSGQTQGPTAFDIVKNASKLCAFFYHIQSTSFGPYLDQIGDDRAQGLIGWLYLVNYIAPSVGAADYTLKPGDSIIWYYGEFDLRPTKLTLSNTQIETGASATAVVECLADNAWSGLSGAKVFFGTSNALTDDLGKAVLAASDGYYKVFAEKEGYIRSNSLLLQVGNPMESQVNLAVNIKKGEIKGKTISFLVDPSSIDFGTLYPGESASRNLTIKNTGTVNLVIEDIVNGDEIFLNNLSLGAVSWKKFREYLETGNLKEVDAKLDIPVNYDATEGNKSGIITFWAAPE